MRYIYFVPAIIWLIISVVLLTLPGNDFPHNPIFDLPYFDKVVHFGMFFLLTTLFCVPLLTLKGDEASIKTWFIAIAFIVIAYGICMEFVQKFFATLRSFDLSDILFDAIGSIAGLVVMNKILTKKIGPNGNRGRNQN